MTGIENVIEHIKSESAALCDSIAQSAVEECERVRASFAKKEQDEYWKFVGAGAKETEHRLEQLNELANQEANKLIVITQQEMVDAAFALAASRLNELPRSVYNRLLMKLGLESGSSSDIVVDKYRKELTAKVATALFD